MVAPLNYSGAERYSTTSVAVGPNMYRWSSTGSRVTRPVHGGELGAAATAGSPTQRVESRSAELYFGSAVWPSPIQAVLHRDKQRHRRPKVRKQSVGGPPNSRGIACPRPADRSAHVMLVSGDVAERGSHPRGLRAMRSSRVAASVSSGQDLRHVLAVEPGDLGCRLFIGRRSSQTAIRPVVGDCRHMRPATSRTDQPGQAATAVLAAASSSSVTNSEMRSLVSR